MDGIDGIDMPLIRVFGECLDIALVDNSENIRLLTGVRSGVQLSAHRACDALAVILSSRAGERGPHQADDMTDIEASG